MSGATREMLQKDYVYQSAQKMAEFAEILRNAVMGDTTGRDLAQVCIENLYQVYEYVDKVMARDLRPLIGILQEIQTMVAKLDNSQ